MLTQEIFSRQLIWGIGGGEAICGGMEETQTTQVEVVPLW
jgi:hypothetical protein